MVSKGTINSCKTILVTGGSRGIGRGIALALAASGYSVAISYLHNREAAEETLALCRDAALRHNRQNPETTSNSGPQFRAYTADLASTTSGKSLVAAVLEHFGDIQGLVNNAGIAPIRRDDLLEMTEESYDQVLNTNLRGVFFLSQQVANHWMGWPAETRTGRLMVFITSVSSEMISLNRGEYCIAKAGLSMTARLFATRLADQGISVFEVRPGIIATDMTSSVKAAYDQLITDGLVPQRRWGSPADIGGIVRDLAGGSFNFATGSVIHADGALHITRL